MNDVPFSIVMYPTPEVVEFTINGTKVPVRVWRGEIAPGGETRQADVYVLSFVADYPSVIDADGRLPAFMRKSRETFTVGLAPGDTRTLKS